LEDVSIVEEEEEESKSAEEEASVEFVSAARAASRK
jgi:hypothetical protein